MRPIVLLTTLRKTLSLVVLSRIAPKVDEYLSPSQSGFRRGRSTADTCTFRQRVSIELLGIDLSRAFDTIRRDKLLDILQTFLGESEMRIIRLLLADTSLEPRLSTGECHAFATSIGTPQGDSLSPVLFTVYLEAALRDLRSRLPTRLKPMPTYRSTLNMPTIPISLAHLACLSTTSNVSHQLA